MRISKFSDLKAKKCITNPNTIEIYLGAYWQTVNPTHPINFFSVRIIENQFDTLISYNCYGKYVGNLATSWSVNTDFTVYTFKLDTTRRFSDGEHFEANHIKEAFKYSLSVTSLSYIASTLGLLSNIKSTANSHGIPQLEGVKVISKDTIELHFEKPFRKAIQILASPMYSIFKITSEGKQIGTGSYIVNNDEINKIATLTPNPFNQNTNIFPNVIFKLHEHRSNSNDSAKDFLYIDIPISRIKNPHKAILLNRSNIIILNGHSGIFTNPNYRKAFQYIFYTQIFPVIAQYSVGLTRDIQFFPSQTPGRLSENEVNNLILEGKDYVNEFLEYIRQNPLKLLDLHELNDIFLKYFPNSTIIFFKDLKDLIDKENSATTYDISSLSTGRLGDDPDGIYDFLGIFASDSFPALKRQRIIDLLKEGRSLNHSDKIKEHYKNVSRAIFQEVPCIHIGFSSLGVAYNSKKVKLINSAKHQHNVFSLNLYQPKKSLIYSFQQHLLTLSISLIVFVIGIQIFIYNRFEALQPLTFIIINSILFMLSIGFFSLVTFFKFKKIYVSPLQNINNEDESLDYSELELTRQKFLSLINLSKEKEKLASMFRTTTMLAHDIRKPFVLVKTLLDHFEHFSKDPSALQEARQEVEYATNHVQSMIHDILDFSREVKLSTIPVDLTPLFPKILKIVMANISNQKIEVQLNLNAKSLPLIDENRISRVFINILNNAVEAITLMAKKDKGTITISTQDCVYLEKNMVEICISNDGPIFTDGVEKRLFQNLFTSGKAKGTGLGLASAKKTVELHSGFIFAQNKSTNDGVEFIIKLPSS